MNIRIYQILFSALVLFSACSDNDSSKEAGGASEAENAIAIEDKTIAGVSEKGPFINGSAVTIYELDFENLAQTGRTYTGKIASDHGDFRFTHVNLVSQYALLEVNGFYRNEITGKESVAPITLNAMVDFSDRRTANINLLTHLAYARMQYLVDDGVSVLEAKKQAEKEILKAFYIQGDVEEFEDLSIFEAGDGNAALLAISILMQGDLNEAKFSSRLANFAYDIEKDGVWEDSVTATQIADWAFSADYDQIESNIKGWNLGTKIPDFRPFVKHYWWYNFGLGDCSAQNDGEQKQVTNKLSKYSGETFACSNSDWVRPWYSLDGEFILKDNVYELKVTNNTIAHLTHTFVGDTIDLMSDCAMLYYVYQGDPHFFQAISPLITVTTPNGYSYYPPDYEYVDVPYSMHSAPVIEIPSNDGWTEVLVHWDFFMWDWIASSYPSKADVLKSITEVEWGIYQNEYVNGTDLKVKNFKCMTEAELYKYEGLESNCKTGDIKKSNKSKTPYLCIDETWNSMLNINLSGATCAKEFNGQIIEGSRYICKDNALMICNEEKSVDGILCLDMVWQDIGKCTEETRCKTQTVQRDYSSETDFFCTGTEWKSIYYYAEICNQEEVEKH